jgi:hypothetical protein
VLQDVADASAASEVTPDEQLPESLRPFALLPQAVADWIEQYLDIRPFRRRGEEFEVPRERLVEFSLLDGIPDALSALVRVHVCSQGWRSPSATLVKPTARILGPTASPPRE